MALFTASKMSLLQIGEIVSCPDNPGEHCYRVDDQV